MPIKRYFASVSALSPMEIEFTEADGPGTGFIDGEDYDKVVKLVDKLITELLFEVSEDGEFPCVNPSDPCTDEDYADEDACSPCTIRRGLAEWREYEPR